MGSIVVGELVKMIGACDGDRDGNNDGIDVITSSVGAAVGDDVVPVEEARLSITCAIISDSASEGYAFKAVGIKDNVSLCITNDEVDDAIEVNHTNEMSKKAVRRGIHSKWPAGEIIIAIRNEILLTQFSSV